MQVVVQNPSSQPRRDWVPFTFPIGQREVEPGSRGSFVTPDGYSSPVVAGPVVGRRIQIAHILADMLPWQSQVGHVSWDERAALDLLGSAAPQHVPFSIQIVAPEAEWTFDMPELGKTQVRGGAVVVDTYTWPRLEGCPYIPTVWLYRGDGLDLVRFQLTLRHSDPTSNRVRQDVKKITLRASVPFSLRWAKQTGRKQSAKTEDGWASTILEDDFTGDSQALCVSGAFLFLPKPATDDIADWAACAIRLQSLSAEMEAGPCFALCGEWAPGPWGPFASPIRVPYWAPLGALEKEAKKNGAKFYSLAGDAWTEPRLGLARQPGLTGDQQGFGMAKGLEIICAGRPLMIDELEYSATQSLACRPGHYCEKGGDPVESSFHINPRWTSWSEITHFNSDVSPERFGKVDGLPALEDLHGWLGRDAEHHSPLMEAAAYALTGSCQIADLLGDVSERLMSELTIPSVHGKTSTNAIGAARAVGRTLQGASWIDWAIGENKLMSRMRQRFEECIWPQWKGRSEDLTQLFSADRDAVRVIDVAVDERMPLGVGWRPPFEAMGAYGVYLLWKRYQDPRMLALVYSVGKTILSFGFRKGSMLWGVHVPDIAVPTIPLTADQYDQGGPWFQEGGGAWDWWGFQGIMAALKAAEVVRDLETESLARNQIDRIRCEAQDQFLAQGEMFHVEQFWRYLEWTLNQ